MRNSKKKTNYEKHNSLGKYIKYIDLVDFIFSFNLYRLKSMIIKQIPSYSGNLKLKKPFRKNLNGLDKLFLKKLIKAFFLLLLVRRLQQCRLLEYRYIL